MDVESGMKPDQARVKNLLTDTVTLLCKNGLQYKHKLRVEGLLGVSIDDSDVFFVHISECLSEGLEEASESATGNESTDSSYIPQSSGKRKRRNVDSHAQSQRHDDDSRPSPSPKSPYVPTPATEVKHARIRIKEERDDVILVKEEREDGHPRRSASMCEARVPPLHDDSPYAAAESALHNLQSNMTAQYQQMQALIGTDGETSKPAKRRLNSEGGETVGGAFVTGMVRNVHDQNSSSQGSTSGAANNSLPPELAAQFSDGGTMSLEPLAGSSTWPTPSGGGGGPGDPMGVLVEIEVTLGANLQLIDGVSKNKFKWEWLNEADSNGDQLSEYIVKLSSCGYAKCTWCDHVIHYGPTGKKAIHSHASSVQHTSQRHHWKGKLYCEEISDGVIKNIDGEIEIESIIDMIKCEGKQKKIFQWDWLEDEDCHGDRLSDYIINLSTPGYANCELCNYKIYFAVNGKKSLLDHAISAKHTKIREELLNGDEGDPNWTPENPVGDEDFFGEIDAKIRNRFKPEWLQEYDRHGDKLSDYIVKLSKPGYARCKWCDYRIYYAPSGKKSLHSHASSKIHIKGRQKKRNQLEDNAGTPQDEVVDANSPENIAVIDANIKNKFRTEWLDEFDFHGDPLSAYIVKLSSPGFALCTWCDYPIYYGPTGKKVIHSHAHTARHTHRRQQKTKDENGSEENMSEASAQNVKKTSRSGMQNAGKGGEASAQTVMRVIDASIKNKFKVGWLEEVDVNGNKLSDYLVKLTTPGYAKCEWCDFQICYGPTGKKVIHSHARSKKHRKRRLEQQNNVTISNDVELSSVNIGEVNMVNQPDIRTDIHTIEHQYAKLQSQENDNETRERAARLIDTPLRNRFKLSWLDETDCNGDLLAEYICKLNEPGIARCSWCGLRIKYGKSGKRNLHAHARTNKHIQIRADFIKLCDN